MHAAVRPYVTGGIALAGASVIAVSPIAPPLPDIQVPNPAQVAASVELAAFVNPISTVLSAIQTSINNLATTGGQVLADPFPVLQQVGVNGLGYANTLGTAGQGLANALGSFATTTLPPALQTAFDQLTSGDVAGTVNTLNNALTTAGLGAIGPLLPVFAIPSEMAQHLLNVTNLLSTGGLPLVLGLSVLSTVEGTSFQFGNSVQAVVDAVRAGDGVTALSGLLNGPAEIAGAFLNGVPSQGFVGILSPSLGLVNVLGVQIPQQIAHALAPAAAMATLAKLTAPSAPSALPSVAPKMVTLPTPAKVEVPAVGFGSIAKPLAPVHIKTTSNNANSTAATTADGAAAGTASSAGSLKTKSDGGKVAPGALGAKSSKASGGVARALSKVGGGHKSKSGSHK
jgi:hypothetical protein